jgi:hypothetical protein
MSEADRVEANNLPVPENAGPTPEVTPVRRARLSLDSWAVLFALGAAALVKLHILNVVKW